MTAISIKNLEFAYSEAGPIVLRIPLLEVAKGERVFLRGASGSGKTTLLNIIGGILQPTEGEVKILDRSFGQMTSIMKDQFRADHLGFIFQTLHLIPYLSPLENVLLPTKFSKKKQQALGAEKVEALLHSLRLNYEEMRTKKTYHLSLGQQQRVAIARALIGDPEIIIADEPTSSIDVEARDRFLDLLFRLTKEKQKTLVFVSHDPSLSRYFDRSIDLAELNEVKGKDYEVF